MTLIADRTTLGLIHKPFLGRNVFLKPTYSTKFCKQGKQGASPLLKKQKTNCLLVPGSPTFTPTETIGPFPKFRKLSNLAH